MGEEKKESKRKYYAHRQGHSQSLSLPQVKKVFMNDVFSHINENHYLAEAAGGYTWAKGIWNPNPQTYILKNLHMENIWPLNNHLMKFDEITFFTIIEFLYDFVSIPETEAGHRYPSRFQKKAAQEDYRKRVNELLNHYVLIINGKKTMYELSKDGEIRESILKGYTELVENIPKTDDSDNIDSKIQYAISLFLRYGSSLDEKKDAIRTLGDVLEYLRDLNIIMPKKDDSMLRQILNKFSIRHHDKSQLSEYSTEEWYEFFFYTFLASIRLLLRFKELPEFEM